MKYDDASMIRLAKQLFTGTPWEEPLKRVHHLLTGRKNTLYDWQTIAIMRRVLRPDSNALDIGAFEGGMLKHMVRLARHGTHMAFEPQPDRYERLVRDFPSVEVRPYAIGDRTSSASFHRMEQHPALSGLSRREKDLASERATEITVPMETLDRAVPADRPIHFLKVDVEGAELGVFRGGMDLLRRNRPVIVFECGIGGADYFGTTPRALHELVTEGVGLHIFLLADWLAGRSPLTRGQFEEQFEHRLHFYFVASPAAPSA
jgi:FkbM family methyltransferase